MSEKKPIDELIEWMKKQPSCVCVELVETNEMKKISDDVEKFLREKYESQKRAEKCPMIFKVKFVEAK